MKPFVTYRPARVADAPLLAGMNQHLIQDEGHSNPMTVPELGSRMKQWLRREYRGVIFERGGEVVGYAVYRLDVGSIYLRQFFIGRKYRRQLSDLHLYDQERRSPRLPKRQSQDYVVERPRWNAVKLRL